MSSKDKPSEGFRGIPISHNQSVLTAKGTVQMLELLAIEHRQIIPSELRHEKTFFLHMHKKGADHLLGNCTSYQQLIFLFIDSSIFFLNQKFQDSTGVLLGPDSREK